MLYLDVSSSFYILFRQIRANDVDRRLVTHATHGDRRFHAVLLNWLRLFPAPTDNKNGSHIILNRISIHWIHGKAAEGGVAKSASSTDGRCVSCEVHMCRRCAFTVRMLYFWLRSLRFTITNILCPFAHPDHMQWSIPRQRCQFMKMVGGGETGRSRQPTYPYFSARISATLFWATEKNIKIK